MSVSHRVRWSSSSVHATYGRSFALRTTGGSGTGALTFVVANGTAKGCALSGTTLKSSTTGTCIVTATKANDPTYASISSAATTVTFAKLAIPHIVRLTFASNSSALGGAARNAIVVLIRKLTVHSVLVITGYAKGNATLAHRRASAAERYLIQRLHVRVQLHWNTSVTTPSVRDHHQESVVLAPQRVLRNAGPSLRDRHFVRGATSGSMPRPTKPGRSRRHGARP